MPLPTPSALAGEGESLGYLNTPGPEELDEMSTSATEEPWLEPITPPEIKIENATSEEEPEDYSRETLALVPYVPMDMLPPQNEPLDLSWTPPQDEPLDLSRTQPPELD